MQRARGIDPKQAEEELSKNIVTDEHWSLAGKVDFLPQKMTRNVEYESGYGGLIEENDLESHSNEPNLVQGRASFGLFNKELGEENVDEKDVSKNEEVDVNGTKITDTSELTERERRKQELVSKKAEASRKMEVKAPAKESKKRKVNELSQDVISLHSPKESNARKTKKNKNKKKKKRN